MKKVVLSMVLLSSLILTGCFKDDDTPIIIEEITIINEGNGNGGNEDSTVDVTGAILTNTTWTNDNIYILNQKVVVDNGATLTIQAGTIIKGTPGTGSLASALIIARGAKINAVGTPNAPIIFTSSSDNIEIGQTAGTNLDENDRGLWGGLLVLGNAPCSFSGDISEAQIEGIPADDTFGLYGGTDAADNSGVIQYISIRHGGALIGEGNEINGLTLGGVGTGTIIENIEVVANVDDGIEFFGGTVNVSNLLVWAQGDDAIDIDQAYSGTIDNAVVVLGDFSDHALEIDGPEGTTDGSFTLQNVTLIGNTTTDKGEYADFRSNAQGTTSNIYAYGFKDDSDIELDNDGVATNYNDGFLSFSNWEIVLPAGVTVVEDLFVNKAQTVTVSGFGSEGTAVTQGTQTVGASTTGLSWTYSNDAGNLGF
ncbi:MAG: hypothetical protein HKP00_07445 [Flavobacteriaceae bacterium]|nr:hypothetical protein [Flavobacteriaceae bacterium]NNK60434.1 hypothetical protein [Flavobacteriaceae bacterium]